MTGPELTSGKHSFLEEIWNGHEMAHSQRVLLEQVSRLQSFPGDYDLRVWSETQILSGAYEDQMFDGVDVNEDFKYHDINSRSLSFHMGYETYSPRLMRRLILLDLAVSGDGLAYEELNDAYPRLPYSTGQGLRTSIESRELVAHVVHGNSIRAVKQLEDLSEREDWLQSYLGYPVGLMLRKKMISEEHPAINHMVNDIYRIQKVSMGLGMVPNVKAILNVASGSYNYAFQEKLYRRARKMARHPSPPVAVVGPEDPEYIRSVAGNVEHSQDMLKRYRANPRAFLRVLPCVDEMDLDSRDQDYIFHRLRAHIGVSNLPTIDDPNIQTAVRLCALLADKDLRQSGFELLEASLIRPRLSREELVRIIGETTKSS